MTETAEAEEVSVQKSKQNVKTSRKIDTNNSPTKSRVKSWKIRWKYFWQSAASRFIEKTAEKYQRNWTVRKLFLWNFDPEYATILSLFSILIWHGLSRPHSTLHLLESKIRIVKIVVVLVVKQSIPDLIKSSSSMNFLVKVNSSKPTQISTTYICISTFLLNPFGIIWARLKIR